MEMLYIPDGPEEEDVLKATMMHFIGYSEFTMSNAYIYMHGTD